MKPPYWITLSLVLIFSFIIPAAFSETVPAVETPAEPPNAKIRDRLDFAAGLYGRSLYDMAAEEYRALLEEYPDSPHAVAALYGLAQSYFYAGRYEEAQNELREFARRFPEHPKAESVKQRFSEALYQLNRKDEARENFESLLQSPSSEVRLAAKYYLGKIQFDLENWNQAEGFFQEAAALTGDNPFLDFTLYYLGEISAQKNDFGEARKYFEKIKESKRAEISQLAFFGLGKISFDQGNYDQSYEFFQKAYGMQTDQELSEMAKVNAIKALYNASHYEKVASVYENEKTNFKKPENRLDAALLAAFSYAALDRHADAIPLYEQIGQSPEADPGLKEKALLAKAESLVRSQQPATALDAIAPLVEAGAEIREKALLLKAEALEQKGEPGQSLQTLNEFIRDNPDSAYFPQALLKRGYLYLKTGQYAEARTSFIGFYEAFPDHELAAKVLEDAVLISLKAENWNQAIEDSILFLSTFPDREETPEMLYRLASLYTETGDYDNARQAYQTYFETYGANRPDFYMNAGYNEQLASDYEKAVDYYGQVEREAVGPEPYYALLKNWAYSLIRLERFDEAAEMYAKIIRDYEDNDLSPEVFFWLADHYTRKENPEKIQVVLENFSKKPEAVQYPGDAAFYHAEAMRFSGNCEQALNFYEKAFTDSETRRPRILLGKGMCLTDLSRFEEALPAYEEALRLSAEDHLTAVQVRMKLGELYEQSGDALNAGKAYFAIAILYEDPDTVPKALLKAGESFLKAEKREEARQAFSELRDRFPEHPMAAKARERLEATV